MVSRTVTVQNKIGLHARPAALLVDTAKQYSCDVTIQKGEMKSSLKGLIGLMTMQCRFGDEVTISCHGPDEHECLEKLCALIYSKFGEG